MNDLSQLATLVRERSATDKALLLAELVRDVIEESGPTKTVLIKDVEGIPLGILFPMASPYRDISQLDWNSPEFWAEIRRREESEPTIPAHDFLNMLK